MKLWLPSHRLGGARLRDQRGSREEQKLKVVLGCRAASRLDWPTRNPVLKNYLLPQTKTNKKTKVGDNMFEN